MRQTVPALRRAAIVLVAVSSVIAAVFLVWQLVTRDQVAALSNGMMVGMLALFVLPAATFAAWELDRRAARGALAEPGQADASVEAQEPETLDLHEFAPREANVHTHEARSGQPGIDARPRHRRQAMHADTVRT